ncbi:MAG: cation diffusion facilitator family transporter [Acidobacteriota bacterium]
MTVRTVLIIEGCANLLVLVTKVIVGWSTGSVAILGDAVHSLTDLASNGLALAALRLSAEPPDREHPYGHWKFEPLAVFGLATFLTVIAVEIGWHAIGRIGQPVAQSGWGLALMLGVLAINTVVTAWEHRQARRLGSDLLHADARHTLSDVLTTIAVIAGWQFASRGWPWLDAVFALLIAGLVFYLAFDLYRRAIPALVDRAATDAGDVIQTVHAIPSVRAVRRVRSRASGSGIAADVVIAVDGMLSTAEAHGIADSVEAVLESEFGIKDVTVHIEPDEELTS